MSLDVRQTEERPAPTSAKELARTFAAAEKPRGALLLGLEHEKLLFTAAGQPVPYEGASGIGAVLEGFGRFGFADFREGPGAPPIAMTRGLETITLEPGGQVELSGSPFATAREAHAESVRHASELSQVVAPLGLATAALGYRPFGAPDGMPWMPKTRYRTMRETLGRRGRLAHHMMLMTATGQVSLDFRDEADCARKVTAAVRVAPLLVALYANSPLAHGEPTGYQSWRSRVWAEVDPSRCGYPPCMLDGSFSYEAYVEWTLDAPMLFLRRDGRYVDPQCTFRQLLAKGWEGKPALESDWVDHLSTMFPEVRLKRVIEIRSADAVNLAQTGALAALMRGILYDDAALDEATRLLPPLQPRAHLELHAAAQVQGLGARLGAGALSDYAADLVAIASRGLGRLDPLDAPLLEPLAQVAAGRRSPAEGVLEAFARDPRPERFLAQFPL
ncbi:MAG: glutamate--cysteine ligase [Myxococcales bacterium]|nr:glutamate--cysteine ligase [Myxococcales bacterium]